MVWGYWVPARAPLGYPASICNKEEFPQHNHTSNNNILYNRVLWRAEGMGHMRKVKTSWCFLPIWMCSGTWYFDVFLPTWCSYQVTNNQIHCMCWGWLEHTGHGFSSIFFLGKGCFSTLHANSSSHFKVMQKYAMRLRAVILGFIFFLSVFGG